MVRSASDIRVELKQAAVDWRLADAGVIRLFREVLERKLYQGFGFPSVHAYAEGELGFSRSKTAELVRLADRLASLPKLEAAVEAGELGWTTARRLTSVITPTTEAAWIARATKGSRRDLEKEIARSRDAARTRRQIPNQLTMETSAKRQGDPLPVSERVTLRFTSEEYSAYVRAIESRRRRGDARSREEIVLEAMLSDEPKVDHQTRQHHNPYRVVTYVCGSCRGAHTPTPRGDRPVALAELAAQLENADLVDEHGRLTRAIAPRVRRQVLVRDGHRCRTAGCKNTTFLEVHHLKPRSRGGTNNLENLITLCWKCHRAVHRRLISQPDARVDGRIRGSP